jgi:hypothetical protein
VLDRRAELALAHRDRQAQVDLDRLLCVLQALGHRVQRPCVTGRATGRVDQHELAVLEPPQRDLE